MFGISPNENAPDMNPLLQAVRKLTEERLFYLQDQHFTSLIKKPISSSINLINPFVPGDMVLRVNHAKKINWIVTI
jgi:hypothetical protein